MTFGCMTVFERNPKVDLVEWDGYLRLASPNLETWAAYDGLRPLSSLHSEAVLLKQMVGC